MSGVCDKLKTNERNKMIDMFEEYGYDLFDNPSLVRDIELQVSEVSCECDGFYICSDHTQQ